MSLQNLLEKRSGSTCELCKSNTHLTVYCVSPKNDENTDHNILICEECLNQVEKKKPIDTHHWRFLNESIWSEIPAVKIISWRILQQIKNENWAGDLLDMMYLEEDELKWAQASGDHLDEDDKIIHKDSNGAILQPGDTVTLIKDLDVKGGNFTAKRGTTVRNIQLVDNNAEHIEGKVEGQHIVILTKFVKKA